MYHAFVEECKKGLGADRVQSGIFGSTCEIALINDVSSAPFLSSPAVSRSLSRPMLIQGTNDNHVQHTRAKGGEIICRQRGYLGDGHASRQLGTAPKDAGGESSQGCPESSF